MSDHTILEMFKEKNDKILVDKLLLDIDNNDDSLRLTINNKIDLITSKLQKRLNDFLKLNNIDYDIKSLSEFIGDNKEKIRFLVMETLDLRKQNFENNVKAGAVALKSIDEPDKQQISEEFNLKINQIIYVDMLDIIYKMYTFTNETQKEDLIEKCLKKYDFELSLAITDSIVERNKSLVNVMNETNQKVQELNDKTSNKYFKKIKTDKKNN